MNKVINTLRHSISLLYHRCDLATEKILNYLYDL